MWLSFQAFCPDCHVVNGTVDFYQNDINTTASSTVNTYGTKTTVQGMTLTSILSIHQLESVDVCKIDAEGAEGESLTFEQLEPAASIIKSYYIETHNCPKDTWQEKMGRIVRDLARLGYRRMIFTNGAYIPSLICSISTSVSELPSDR